MTSSRVLSVAAAFVLVATLFVRTDHGQAPALAERVQPRPRLMFAPGELDKFKGETTGPRRAAFERMTAEIDARGSKAWNEPDLQLESQALAARVLLDRGDQRGERYLGYARQSAAAFLRRHTYTNWRESHDIVTQGGRWIEAMSFAHDWLHDRWTPDERQRIGAWLAAEIEDWVGNNRLARASASPFRNDAARGTAALVLAGITLYDESGHEEAARRALSHARPYYDAMLAAHAYAGAGGGMAEGTFYGNFTAWAQTLVAEALYTGGGVAFGEGRTGASAGASVLGTADLSATDGTSGEAQATPAERRHRGLTTVAATDPADVAQWDRRVSRMIRNGELKLRATVRDTLVAGRTHERYVQAYRGVPVFGGDLARQVEGGRTVSIFGALYGDITIDTKPALGDSDAASAFQKLSGPALGPSRPPELMVLPTDDGAYRLTYRARIATADDVVMTFIDAATGDAVLTFSDLKRPVR